MTSFEQAKEVLKRCFGHDRFRPEQERAIKAIMGKRDVLAVMSTGAGKSLIYQVPAVALGGTTIVVSPLVSLMSDQVGKLLDLGLHPAFLNNTLSLRAQERVRNRIKSGEFQILYVTPERLSSPAFLSAIENLAIPLVAVDEAHCISEWGHDFRSDYREISTFIERFDRRPTVVALTATATPRVRKDIARSLGLQNPLEIVSSFDRANLSLSVVHMPHDERGSWCVRIAHSKGSECGIFYCVTISETERIHDALKRAGVPAALYHGKLDNDAKKAAQEAFMSGQAPVMVATSAFGMGIDKPDVRYVVCCGMPLSIESYYQQIGRAGRDGKPADTIMLWDEQDLQTALFMAEAGGEGQSDPQRSRQKGLAFDMRDFCRDEDTCRRDLVLRYFGEKPPDDGGCGRCDNCAAPVDGIVRAEDARPLTDDERDLFGSLKSACAAIAEGGGVGGALTERALRGICRKKPGSLEQLLKVDGMTAKTAQTYGAQILAVVEAGGPRFRQAARDARCARRAERRFDRDDSSARQRSAQGGRHQGSMREKRTRRQDRPVREPAMLGIRRPRPQKSEARPRRAHSLRDRRAEARGEMPSRGDGLRGISRCPAIPGIQSCNRRDNRPLTQRHLSI